ncbi:hypothetical protein [uncultured Sphingomonas sp.]|uniref:hypothetical protein n=1 Tax=uncultured Sphingomonas sp. TaxID=158754 RepID=UPI0025D88030|nr:hypothetical protein [uncultured Sphingomonas sp.]
MIRAVMPPASAASLARPPLIAAALLALATLLVFAPGYAQYDTVSQFGQVLSGAFDDWHPPAMVQLWTWLHPLGRGTTPMFAVQVVLYWAGLGLIAAALPGRRRQAGVLALGASPLFLGWQVVVLKDAQMIAAAIAATGLVAAFQLRGRAAPIAAVASAALLFLYALLLRANAVFALAPLIAALTPIGGIVRRVAVTVAITAAVLAGSQTINHRVIGSAQSGVEKTQPLFDLAGIAARSDATSDTGLLPSQVAQLRQRRCVSPFFWDPLGEPSHCADVIALLNALPSRQLYVRLASAVLHHPLAYARQRLSHWNVTERWMVPAGMPSDAPPTDDEPNDVGLAPPGRIAAPWQRLAAALAATPLGWPIAWLAAAVLLAWAIVLKPDATPIGSTRRRLALGLLASAIALEASFLFVSIASDLRYHLWPMLATGVAALVAPRPEIGRRGVVIACIVASAVILPGVAARTLLPVAPATYQAMLRWDAGAIALLNN